LVQSREWLGWVACWWRAIQP